ncbi:hypothetical protein CDAR_77641 [Caerostris darwini]|uniref:Uncharacterized protein n=1 Tax=Caerostris darwini TaxID=1538125 RepID=A0AAV4V446_9ARAC|nr:hypothetical protein CDAR_77641 [Caerostris darwini]
MSPPEPKQSSWKTQSQLELAFPKTWEISPLTFSLHFPGERSLRADDFSSPPPPPSLLQEAANGQKGAIKGGHGTKRTCRPLLIKTNLWKFSLLFDSVEMRVPLTPV